MLGERGDVFSRSEDDGHSTIRPAPNRGSTCCGQGDPDRTPVASAAHRLATLGDAE